MRTGERRSTTDEYRPPVAVPASGSQRDEERTEDRRRLPAADRALQSPIERSIIRYCCDTPSVRRAPTVHRRRPPILEHSTFVDDVYRQRAALESGQPARLTAGVTFHQLPSAISADCADDRAIETCRGSAHDAHTDFDD